MAAQMEARSLMDRAREGAFKKLDSQRERAATGLGSMVDALRESGRQLEGQNATMASYVSGAASQLERFSGGIRDRDVQQIVRDVEQFARHRPAIFLGSAFALGLATARFLKSSSSESEAGASSASSRTSGAGSSYSTGRTWPDEPRADAVVGGSMGTSAGGANPAGPATAPGTADWGGEVTDTPAFRG
jgi:hypothetical protein